MSDSDRAYSDFKHKIHLYRVQIRQKCKHCGRRNSRNRQAHVASLVPMTDILPGVSSSKCDSGSCERKRCRIRYGEHQHITLISLKSQRLNL